MIIIKHKFIHHKISPDTEILLVGTFNPDASNNPAEFFYGRERNYMWKLLPSAFNDVSLKGRSRKEKLDFIHQRKIDFIDLISEVEVETGEETNYEDKYLDSKVKEWRNVVEEMKMLHNLKKVAFTRKTFSDIPEMKAKVIEIQEYCNINNIHFQFLNTPARTYSESKQTLWTDFINNDN